MKYNNITKATFLSRPNRFIADVRMEDGHTERVHVKNTGRCRELLAEGSTVWLTCSDNPDRSTRYDLVAVEKPGKGIFNIDSQAANTVMKEWLNKQDYDLVRPEYRYGGSRIDFYMERGNERYLLEVKGCTLERGGVGYFPDAPTERGSRHLRELAASLKDGYRAGIAFVIQAECMSEVRPNGETDPAFAEAFREAVSAGVDVFFCRCRVAPDTLEITDVIRREEKQFRRCLNCFCFEPVLSYTSIRKKTSGGNVMPRYSIGIDFGSLSARAVVMDLDSGDVLTSAVSEYEHGILTDRLPNGVPLAVDWAVQIPQDYLDSLAGSVRAAVAEAGITPEQVAGIGLDVTASTMLPTDAEGAPLCEDPRFSRDPNSYIKVWKHHAAQKYADMIEDTAKNDGSGLLDPFGGHISGEHFLPKAMQICMESPELYKASTRILEVGDWLVWKLCGRESRGYCGAAFKTYYSEETGDVPSSFFRKISPELTGLSDRYPRNVVFPGDCAGTLTEKGAELLGLVPGIPVAAAGVDAHTTVYGCGVSKPGQFLMIIGTSTCEMLLSDTLSCIDGISGVVNDSIFKDMYTYECGQSGIGDMFAWFADNQVPQEYRREAEEKGLAIQQLLTQKASALRPGENGLVALDWWNGVRSTLMDFSLSGVIAGLTTETKPEEIYRALLESTAFGCRKIIDTLESEGVRIDSLIATGGIPHKNPLMMQIYADVMGRDVFIADRDYTGSVGSAIMGAAAAGDGFSSLAELTEKYALPFTTVYRPDPGSQNVYNGLYGAYCDLYSFFGGRDSLLHRLKDIRKEARGD